MLTQIGSINNLWLEEPLGPEAFEDFARLTQLANIAIAGGEDFILLRDFENLSNIIPFHWTMKEEYPFLPEPDQA